MFGYLAKAREREREREKERENFRMQFQCRNKNRPKIQARGTFLLPDLLPDIIIPSFKRRAFERLN